MKFFEGLGYSPSEAHILLDERDSFIFTSFYVSDIWHYVVDPLEEGKVHGPAKQKKEDDLRNLLNWRLYEREPYYDTIKAKKNLSVADWKYFKILRTKMSEDMLYNKNDGVIDGGLKIQASWDASLQKLRRFMNFFKWALIPRQKKTVFEENEKNLSDYNILQNFGYNSNECTRIRGMADTRPETKKH